MKQNKIENLIVTTGKNGAILFKKNNFYYSQNKYKKKFMMCQGQVILLSYLVVGHIFKLNIKEAISLANHASLLAISRYGISSINKKIYENQEIDRFYKWLF